MRNKQRVLWLGGVLIGLVLLAVVFQAGETIGAIYNSVTSFIGLLPVTADTQENESAGDSTGKKNGDLNQDGEKEERKDFEFTPPERDDDDEEGEGQATMVVMITEDAGGGGGEVEAHVGEDGEVDVENLTFSVGDLDQYMPEYTPDIRGILPWPDGRFWVITSKDKGDKMVTDEWNADGEYLKRFTLPQSYQLFAVGADGELYAVGHDEDDYPILYRLEVVPAN